MILLLVRRLFVASVVGLLLISTSVAAQGEDSRLSGPAGPSNTSVTVPKDSGPRYPFGNGEFDPEVLIFADEWGVSPEEALRNLEAEAEMVVFAESVKSEPGFVDFMVTDQGQHGVLVVEPGVSHLGGIPVPANVEVQKAALPKPALEKAREGIATAARRVASAAFVGVSYDPFDNSYTVWLHKSDSTAKLRADVADEVQPVVDSASRGASIQIAETEPKSQFYGGKLAFDGEGVCTTGFGVWKAGVGGGYLTAGHCKFGPWVVNGYLSTSVQDYQQGGYDDREVIVAPGASWWVQVALNGFELDMASTPGHIFLGVSYCHFGRAGDLDCGNITSVNVPVGGNNGSTVWTSVSTAKCAPGDSGGPVWKYHGAGIERTPHGLIEGGDTDVPPVNGEYPCYYVALDDQLQGLAWVLY